MIKKLFILLIKYMPVIQLAGMLLNNTLYYFDINRNLTYLFDFTIGNSIITTILMYICSYTFQFCIWHRLIITANFINVLIATIDCVVGIPVKDIELLTIYYAVSCIFILLITMLHINKKL